MTLVGLAAAFFFFLVQGNFVVCFQGARGIKGRRTTLPLLQMTAAIQTVTVGSSENPYEIQLQHKIFLGDLQPLQSTNGREDLTGLKFWPQSSTALLKKLEKNNPLRKKKSDDCCSILVLGSGCGLLGIGLAVLYPNSRVILTDAPVDFTTAADKDVEENSEPTTQSTMDWLEGNVERNQHLVQDRVSVAPLLWGNEAHQQAISNNLLLNSSQGQGQIDLIVGSELLYNNEASFRGLLDTLLYFLGDNGNATILLVYRQRKLGESRFFDMAEDYFSIETTRIGRKSDGIFLAELSLLP